MIRREESNEIYKINFNYYRAFVKNNIFSISAYTFNYIRSIVILPLLVKNIGTTSYGGYVLLALSLGFIAYVATLGTGFHFRRYISSAENAIKRRDLFYPQFIFQIISALIISVILIAGRNYLKDFFLKREIYFSVYLTSAILIAYALYFPATNYFRYSLGIKCYSLATAIMPLLTILFIAVAFFVFHEKTLNSVLFAMFLSAFAVSLPLLVKIYKEIGFLPFNFNLRKIVEDIYMGFPLVLSYIVDFILSVSDRYVIGIIISTAAVGFYNPAYTLGSILLLFPKICSEMVLFPLLSNAADKNKDNEMKIMVDYTIKIFLTIAIPFIVGSFFLSKPLLELFVNKETADKAYLAIPIVATGILFYGLTLIYSQMLLVRLETRVIFAINAVIAILNLVLNIILISIFKNILIAAITTLISYLIAFAIFHKVIKKYIFINYDFKIFVKCFFSSLVMGVFLLYFYVKRITSFIGVSLAISCAVFIYFLMLFFLKVFNEKEKTFIKDFFNIGKKLI